jgi:hypothetical protein
MAHLGQEELQADRLARHAIATEQAIGLRGKGREVFCRSAWIKLLDLIG